MVLPLKSICLTSLPHLTVRASAMLVMRPSGWKCSVPTGLTVTAVRYHSSQPWPFPSNLMLGFIADYAGGELRLQEDEIAEAGFYPYDQLPLVPPPGSIARLLIDHVVRERTNFHEQDQ